jgi:hypothetical protein
MDWMCEAVMRETCGKLTIYGDPLIKIQDMGISNFLIAFSANTACATAITCVATIFHTMATISVPTAVGINRDRDRSTSLRCRGHFFGFCANSQREQCRKQQNNGESNNRASHDFPIFL